MSEILVGMAALPAIIAIVAYLKQFIPDARLAPALSIGVAVAYHALLKWWGVADLVDVAWGQTMLQAFVVGLAASGLYSGAVKPALPPSP